MKRNNVLGYSSLIFFITGWIINFPSQHLLSLGGIVEIDNLRFPWQMASWAIGVIMALIGMIVVRKQESKKICILGLVCNVTGLLFPVAVTAILASHS